MEIKTTIPIYGAVLRLCLCVCLLITSPFVFAQDKIKTYTINNGRMEITLSKNLTAAELDGFNNAFGLEDIPLKHIIKTNATDTLRKLGWTVNVNNKKLLVISKPLFGLENLSNAADKIVFADKNFKRNGELPSDHNDGFGYNRFRNKKPFRVNGAAVTFYLKNNQSARSVFLAGSFNNWSPNGTAMKKTDSGWIADVSLTPGKYEYKFIVDGNWIVDNDNQRRENDGRANINSIYYKTNVLFTLGTHLNARRVYLAGSFNKWKDNELLMQRSMHGWEIALYLPDGTHTYKYVADGNWLTDEINKERLPDGVGGYNSVIRIGQAHRFLLTGYTGASHVYLTGTFNNWREDELKMTKTATGWYIDYIIGPGNYQYKFKVDNEWIKDPGNPYTSLSSGNSFITIQPNYTFKLKGYSSAKSVLLAGDFTDWRDNPLPMKHEGDEWTFSVRLDRGKQRYKFIIDGEWVLDPQNKLWEQNEFGTGNSVLWVE